MGTSRAWQQQSSFPVFLQMQHCISRKCNVLFLQSKRFFCWFTICSHTAYIVDKTVFLKRINISVCPKAIVGGYWTISSKQMKTGKLICALWNPDEWNFKNILIVMQQICLQICRDKNGVCRTMVRFVELPYQIVKLSNCWIVKLSKCQTLEL